MNDLYQDYPDHTLLDIDIPYQITDSDPDIYKYAQELYKPKLEKNKIFTIGVHVRRGELHLVDSDRMLDNQYYINLINIVANICDKYNIDYIVELYTEIPNNSCVIKPSNVCILNRIPNDIEINSTMDNIDEFNGIKNLVKYINLPLFETFDRMINCDILITSRSSFSACASYLKTGISLYKPFWHNMLTKDISSDDPHMTSKIDSYVYQYSVVPKIIHQIWIGEKQINTDKIYKNLYLYNDPKEYKYIMYNDEQIYKFLSVYFPHLLKTYNIINNYAHKSDLVRYCILYLYGGIYLDVDLEVKSGFNDIILNANNPNNTNNTKMITAIGAHSNSNFGECCNGFIITKKYNPIFLDLINLIVKDPNPVDYGNNVKQMYNRLFSENNIYYYKEVKIDNKYFMVNNNGEIIININSNANNYLEYLINNNFYI